MATGRETGGEWISAAQGDEPDTDTIEMAAPGQIAYATNSVGCRKFTSDELLIAAK
jgi:hypothetical protein